MNHVEEMLIWAVGKLLSLIGVSGAIFTLFFDNLSRGLNGPIGMWQSTGIVVFSVIAVVGYFADRFLMKEVMPIVKEYLNK